MVTQERLKELLQYDTITGIFTWRISRGTKKAGCIAGNQCRRGYRRIDIDSKKYLAHRLAWLYVNGEWPREEIDHIDHDPTNNRISNLRDVSKNKNQHNQKMFGRKNGNLLTGVRNRPSGRFQAVITVNAKFYNLGTFDTELLAHEAYLIAKRKLHEGNTL